MDNSSQSELFQKLGESASNLIQLRKRPLLVIYYPEIGGIRRDDLDDIHDEFKRNNFQWNKKIDNLDVVLHTLGGDVQASYLIAQIFHDYAENITMLIPKHAYSGGTLICLGSNEIRLGRQASISPIDISVGGIQLINIDHYINFVRHSKQKMGDSSKIEEPLLVELVKQVGALDIGKFFRERQMTRFYANILLNQYMFKDFPDKLEKSTDVIDKLVVDNPSHNFDIDFHLCNDGLNLNVSEMQLDEYELCESILNMLIKLDDLGIICKYVGNDYKQPFFKLFI